MYETLRKSYNLSAKTYDKKFSDLQYKKYNKAINNNIFINMNKSFNILDLGCGTGLFYKFMSENNYPLPNITGIDFSEEMLSIAAEYGINTILGDISLLPLNDSFFDAVVSFTVIRILDADELKIFSEVNRVLKTGGTFVLTILAKKVDSTLDENLIKSGFMITESFECGQDTAYICRKK